MWSENNIDAKYATPYFSGDRVEVVFWPPCPGSLTRPPQEAGDEKAKAYP